jgi:hypothetical protein
VVEVRDRDELDILDARVPERPGGAGAEAGVGADGEDRPPAPVRAAPGSAGIDWATSRAVWSADFPALAVQRSRSRSRKVSYMVFSPLRDRGESAAATASGMARRPGAPGKRL